MTMIDFQGDRRSMLARNPAGIGRAIATKGIGSTGNTSHLNMTKPLEREFFDKAPNGVNPK